MKISVVIPLYNHENYIESTVQSVLEQTVLPDEIIIIDDGSKDSSLAKARELSTKASGLINVYSQKNCGAHNTINRGILLAKNDLVAILNSDDLFARKRFEECLQLFQSDSALAAVATGIAFIDGSGNEIADVPWYENAVAYYKETGNLMLGLLNANFFMTTSNFIFRKRVIRDIGLFANLRYAHDYDFFLRLLATRYKVLFHDHPLVKYRMHTSNTIREDLNKVLIETVFVLAMFLWLLKITGNDRLLDQQKVEDLLDKKEYSPVITKIFNYWDMKQVPFSKAYTAMEDKSFYDSLYSYFGEKDNKG